jgi:hypothetical protein
MLRDWTIEEVWVSLPSWIKPMIKEEKSLKEGLEKTSEKQDNRVWISCFAFRMFIIGCSPFWAKIRSRFF